MAFPIIIAGLLMACSDESDRKQNLAASSDEVLVLLLPTLSPVKLPPYVDDPALSAQDERSCIAGGGQWSEIYSLGTLSSREPFDAEYYSDPKDALITYGKRCWSLRKPVTYADAGKSCRGQSDCEMNCIAQRLERGGFDSPKCQANEWDQPNCEYIYDKGQYLPSECAIP